MKMHKMLELTKLLHILELHCSSLPSSDVLKIFNFLFANKLKVEAKASLDHSLGGLPKFLWQIAYMNRSFYKLISEATERQITNTMALSPHICRWNKFITSFNIWP